MKDTNGCTALTLTLMTASRKGHVEIVELLLLLNKQADINTAVTIDGYSSLSYAELKGQQDLGVEIILIADTIMIDHS